MSDLNLPHTHVIVTETGRVYTHNTPAKIRMLRRYLTSENVHSRIVLCTVSCSVYPAHLDQGQEEEIPHGAD